ncbi:PAS-domain containing protein [Chachezhania antarctica]|uniref:PAS-domain containing protein n=1 Tax=Chachezhania antarctica TaxID=2340860 RepID=UPI001F08CF98|nr:PAS-domain containing protein [Chachezhania antarctica]
MHTLELAELVVTTAICTIAALAAVSWLWPSRGRSTMRRTATGSVANLPTTLAQPDAARGSVFLFDGEEMIGASGPAREALRKSDEPLRWPDLVAVLAARFSDLPHSLDSVERAGRLVSQPRSQTDPSEIVFEWLDGTVRVEIRERLDIGTGNSARALAQGLTGGASDDRSTQGSRARWIHKALAPVVGQRRATGLVEALGGVTVACIAAEKSPYPVWQTNASGEVIWSNAAYVALARRVLGEGEEKGRPLFPSRLDRTPDGRPVRHALEAASTRTKLWFEISHVTAGDGHLFFATDINAVVNAEYAQRNFVQTLAKTFAQLSIGLAIFDRNQRLALFNPALIDLTALPAEFLSARPDLFSFFDRLRDRSVMPEPKDYATWRQQLSELVAAAANGRYQETWSLPSGSVYSVSGRPHPDGAVAFLFEDITAEVTLTRRFRSDLELGQSVIEALEDAVAVFSSDGALAVSNPAYGKLWGVDPDAGFAQTTVIDAIRTWQDKCRPTPTWGDVRDFVTLRENRSEWSSTAFLRTGEAIWCGVYPVHGGATLVRFVRTDRTRGELDMTTAPPVPAAVRADPRPENHKSPSGRPKAHSGDQSETRAEPLG